MTTACCMRWTANRSCAPCPATRPLPARPAPSPPHGWRRCRLPERDDPLGVDPETMRALGYRTVDMLASQLGAVRDGPALRRASPAEMRDRLPTAPGEPRDFEALLDELERDVLPYM